MRLAFHKFEIWNRIFKRNARTAQNVDHSGDQNASSSQAGACVKALRTSMGYSRSTMAEILGVTVMTLRRWEEEGAPRLEETTLTTLSRRQLNNDSLSERALRFPETSSGAPT